MQPDRLDAKVKFDWLVCRLNISVLLINRSQRRNRAPVEDLILGAWPSGKCFFMIQLSSTLTYKLMALVFSLWCSMRLSRAFEAGHGEAYSFGASNALDRFLNPHSNDV